MTGQFVTSLAPGQHGVLDVRRDQTGEVNASAVVHYSNGSAVSGVPPCPCALLVHPRPFYFYALARLARRSWNFASAWL